MYKIGKPIILVFFILSLVSCDSFKSLAKETILKFSGDKSITIVCKGDNDGEKFRSAISSLERGGTINVDGDKCSGGIQIENRKNLSFYGNGITITGTETIPAFTILNSRDISFTGFNFTNGAQGLKVYRSSVVLDHVALMNNYGNGLEAIGSEVRVHRTANMKRNDNREKSSSVLNFFVKTTKAQATTNCTVDLKGNTLNGIYIDGSSAAPGILTALIVDASNAGECSVDASRNTLNGVYTKNSAVISIESGQFQANNNGESGVSLTVTSNLNISNGTNSDGKLVANSNGNHGVSINNSTANFSGSADGSVRVVTSSGNGGNDLDSPCFQASTFSCGSGLIWGAADYKIGEGSNVNTCNLQTSTCLP